MSFLHTLWQRRRYITATNWVKSLWFNIAKLPLKQGIKLPVLLSRHVKLKLSRGGVFLDAPSRFGMVLLGYEDIPTQDNRYNRMSVFVGKGSAIVFKGSAKIGGGTQLLVRGNSQLVLGDG